MRVTKASVELSKRFELRGRQRDCSQESGIGQSKLSRLATGELFPRADEAVSLQTSDGIPVEWWSENASEVDVPLPTDHDSAIPSGPEAAE